MEKLSQKTQNENAMSRILRLSATQLIVTLVVCLKLSEVVPDAESMTPEMDMRTDAHRV